MYLSESQNVFQLEVGLYPYLALMLQMGNGLKLKFLPQAKDEYRKEKDERSEDKSDNLTFGDECTDDNMDECKDDNHSENDKCENNNQS